MPLLFTILDEGASPLLPDSMKVRPASCRGQAGIDFDKLSWPALVSLRCCDSMKVRPLTVFQPLRGEGQA